MLQGAGQYELTPLVPCRLPMNENNRPGLLWGVNVFLLVAIYGWVLSSGRSHAVMRSMPVDAGIVPAVVLGLILGSLTGIFLALFKGPPRYRTLKAWLGFTALVSVWCALAVSWQGVHWFGQTVRLRADVDAYKAVAEELRENWPGQDGRTPLLGPFTAYPISNPQTLLLLGIVGVPGADAPLVAVERLEQGALSFQLAGSEAGAWLEWHPPGSIPKSFVGGMQNGFVLLRQTQLRPGWYLVRYGN